MREKVRVRAACVLVGAKVWRQRVGARRSVADKEVCRGAPAFVRRVSTGVLEARPLGLCVDREPRCPAKGFTHSEAWDL